MHTLALVLFLFAGGAFAGAIPKGLVPTFGGRIYGGQEAVVGQFPYAATFRFFGLHRCGSVIVRHNAVLTAAHCVYQQPANLMEVAMGLVIRNWGGVERWIRGYVIHPEFDIRTYSNDVAIAYMKESVDFTPSVQPIAMASVGEDLKAGTIATVSGWGTLNDEGHLPEKLQYVKIRIVDRDVCAQAYQGLNEVRADMICAGEPEGGKDACSGDSGGPLVVGNKLYGLVSWGDDCGSRIYPGVYVSVGAHRNWIEDQLD